MLSTCQNLGDDYKCINQGIESSNSNDWAFKFTSAHGSGNDILEEAISNMQENNVDIVSIMLGANDARNDNHNSKDQYKIYMQHIINRLKSAGFRQVILNYPIYFGLSTIRDKESQELNIMYQQAIDELVLENDGYVLLGDITGYMWFMSNYDDAIVGGTDTVHPNDIGHAKLGELWALSIESVICNQTYPNSKWVDNVNHYVIGSEAVMVFSIEKSIGEFAGVIYIDDIIIDENFYKIQSGLHIVFDSNYLNTLDVGTHTMQVVFNGGIYVLTEFQIIE